MKIFNSSDSWSTKINFVDRNNLLVGFNYAGCCCEWFGYLISTDPNEIPEQDEKGAKLNEKGDYIFDPDYKKNISFGYEGAGAQFRLTCENLPDLYLTVFNSHNGYYGHGFNFCNGETVLWDGCL